MSETTPERANRLLELRQWVDKYLRAAWAYQQAYVAMGKQYRLPQPILQRSYDDLAEYFADGDKLRQWCRERGEVELATSEARRELDMAYERLKTIMPAGVWLRANLLGFYYRPMSSHIYIRPWSETMPDMNKSDQINMHWVFE